MKQVNLKDIIPAKPEFHIKATNKTYSLRPPNLMDQEWIAGRFPQSELARVFGLRNWKEICVIVYRHLEPEGRSDFKPRKGIQQNDDGHDTEVDLSGPEVLLVSLASGEEAAAMMAAMVRALVLARPEMEELVATEVKKNLKTYLPPSQPIGQKSLTRSPRNTGGPKRK